MRLHFQSGAELRLAARAPQEEDELTRDGKRGRGTQIIFDEGEAEINPGRDTGRGVEWRFGDEDCIRLHPDLRKQMAHPMAGVPVGGGAAAVEESCRSQDEGPGAHARNAAGA